MAELPCVVALNETIPFVGSIKSGQLSTGVVAVDIDNYTEPLTHIII